MTENGKRGEAYYKLKDEVANKLIKKVEGTLIPNLSKHIVVKDAATPMTFERYTCNKEGAWYGPRLPFRTWEDLETSMLTPIEGLYLAGHNNRAGGMPMALISGFMTANRIIEKGKKH